MGRKATDPGDENNRKAELPGGTSRHRIFSDARVMRHLCLLLSARFEKKQVTEVCSFEKFKNVSPKIHPPYR